MAGRRRGTTQDRQEFTDTIPSTDTHNLVQFVFLGDIVEAALEVIVYNQGVDEDIFDTQSRPTPFFTELNSDGSLGPQAQKAINLYGKYLFGDIVTPGILSPTGGFGSGTWAPHYVNLADLPIELEAFRTFWFNNVIAKPQVKRYYLKNLVNDIINNLIPRAVRNKDNESPASDRTYNPQAMLNYFSLSGNPSYLNVETSSRLASPAQVNAVCEAYANLNMPCPDNVAEPNAGGVSVLPASTIPYAPYMSLSTIRNNISDSHLVPGTFNVFVIHQKPSSDIDRHGIELVDKEVGIHHFKLSENPKGMLRSIQFKRMDLPSLQTAMLLSDQGANKLGILREKYDASVLLKGNVIYKPGSVLFISHKHVQQAPNAPDHVRSLDWGISTTPARSLGLGGYFVVITVSHDWGNIAEGGEWLTTLDTKWLSF